MSHDIRTPLSIVMGYAGQLENDKRLPEEDRQKATVIVKQSKRMRNLINDLNLASKLEYNMQPVRMEKQNVIAIVPVSYTHLTLPTSLDVCGWGWWAGG